MPPGLLGTAGAPPTPPGIMGTVVVCLSGRMSVTGGLYTRSGTRSGRRGRRENIGLTLTGVDG